MGPDDERHGTTRGHAAGCRETCCGAAKLRYDKRRRWEAAQGFSRRVPSIGSLRRIRALRAIGWSVTELAKHLDVSVSQLQDYGRYPTVYTATHRAIAEMYEALAWATPPRETTAQRHGYTKTKRTAARKGWQPPSAWLDIDDPDERPDPGWRPRHYRGEELIAEWAFLRRAGVSIHSAANQLGVTVGAIEKAIERANKRSAA